MAIKVFWRAGIVKKCFGIAGMAIQVFWCIRSGKQIVLGTLSLDQRAEQNTVITYDYSAPFSCDKIRDNILFLGYGGARRAPP